MLVKKKVSTTTLGHYPKYKYNKLFVSAFEPKHFDPRDPRSLRRAVEHLRTLEPGRYVGITVEALVCAGKFKIQAPASFKLEQIEGKTPAEVWAMFEAQIDEQIDYFSAVDRACIQALKTCS